MGKPKANTNVNTPLGKGVVTSVGNTKSEVLIQDTDNAKNNQKFLVDNNKIQ